MKNILKIKKKWIIVDDGIELDEHRWYSFGTTVVKIYDRYLGIRGICDVWGNADLSDYSDTYEFYEVVEVPTITYKKINMINMITSEDVSLYRMKDPDNKLLRIVIIKEEVFAFFNEKGSSAISMAKFYKNGKSYYGCLNYEIERISAKQNVIVQDILKLQDDGAWFTKEDCIFLEKISAFNLEDNNIYIHDDWYEMSIFIEKFKYTLDYGQTFHNLIVNK